MNMMIIRGEVKRRICLVRIMRIIWSIRVEYESGLYYRIREYVFNMKMNICISI